MSKENHGWLLSNGLPQWLPPLFVPFKSDTRSSCCVSQYWCKIVSVNNLLFVLAFSIWKVAWPCHAFHSVHNIPQSKPLCEIKHLILYVGYYPVYIKKVKTCRFCDLVNDLGLPPDVVALLMHTRVNLIRNVDKIPSEIQFGRNIQL